MTISDLESGKTATPHPALSIALAETFGYGSPADLLNGVRSAAPPPGPGPLTLEGLVASLLRGVWAAQEAGGAGGGARDGVRAPRGHRQGDDHAGRRGGGVGGRA